MNKEPFLANVMVLLADQIQENLPSVREVILKAGKDVIVKSAHDLERWNAMLIGGTISAQEYEWLVESRITVVELDSLKSAGLALARIDELKASIVQSITGAALRAVGI